MKRTLSMLALLGATLAGLAQQPAQITPLVPKDVPKEVPYVKDAPRAAAKDAEPTLSELLERGMKRNPDILVAEAKTRLAEAEMLKSRSEVVAAITATHAELATNRLEVQQAKTSADSADKAFRASAMSQAEKVTWDIGLMRAEQKLTATKLKLASLTGGEKPAAATTTSSATPALQNPQTATLEYQDASAWLGLLNPQINSRWVDLGLYRALARYQPDVAPDSYTSTPAALRKTLSSSLRKSVEVPKGDKELSLREVMRVIHLQLDEDLAIVIPGAFPYGLVQGNDIPLTLPGGKRTVANWLLMIQDELYFKFPSSPFEFVVREYGIVLTSLPKQGNTAVTLRTFLRDMAKNEVNAVPQPTTPLPPASPVPPMKK